MSARTLEGRVALVTGGAHRVGRALTLALAREGAHVVINYHASADAAEETASDARAEGVDAMPFQADVADDAQVRAMVRAAIDRWGRIDVLVNSASLFRKTPFPTDDVSLWHRVLDIQVKGAFHCANAVAPHMQAQGEGHIVNILDLAGFEPWPGYGAHGMGKAAMWALTRQLALELAPQVRVNAIAPGPVLPPPGLSEADMQRIARRTLLGRWGTPQDVADALLFLLRSNYITGEVIFVDGGERLGRKP